MNLMRQNRLPKRADPMASEGEIIGYQPNSTLRLEVKVDGSMALLNRQQMAELFGRDIKTIGKHIANALREELNPDFAKAGAFSADANDIRQGMMPVENPAVAKFATTAADGKVYQVEHYNLEVVVSVGFRVKSPQGILFRRWANEGLKRYMTDGYAIVSPQIRALAGEMDRRLTAHDHRIVELEEKVDYFVKTSLPPQEKVLCDGRMLDAQFELTRIVRMARQRIVLIDNYIDERTLMLLGARRPKVSCTIYTLRPNSPKLAPALANYVKQCPDLPIALRGYKNSHDRFLIVDDTVWHVGASIKDAGSALFAIMKMKLDPRVILTLVEEGEIR